MPSFLRPAAFALCLGLTACGGGGSSPGTPAPASAPEFLYSSGDLLDVEGQTVLRRSIVVGGPDLVVLQDLPAGAVRSLGAFGALGGNSWQLAGARVYAAMDGSDCSSYGCIYQWDAGGLVVTNLSEGNPLYAGLTPGLADFDEAPLARGSFAMWTAWRQLGGYVVHEATGGSYRHIPVPPQASYVGNWGYDVAVEAATAHVVFWGQTAGSGSTSETDVFHWDSVSGMTTRLTHGGAQEMAPQSDGIRVAWQHWPVGSRMEGPFVLMEQPLAGGSASPVSTSATRFLLRDGVLAWTEQRSSGVVLVASAAGATRTLTNNSATLLANAGGHVVYLGNGDSGYGLYEWSVASSRSTFITADAPSFTIAFLASDAVIYQVRDAVYRFAF